MTFRVWSLAERPDLLADAERLGEVAYPPFMHQDPVSADCWEVLYTDHLAGYQRIATLEDGTVVGQGNCIPFYWPEGAELPDEGWDAVLRGGFEDATGARQANALSALSIAIAPSQRGTELAEIMLGEMRQAARENGLHALVAPVRPTRKADYPLQSFDTYCAWVRADGSPFDPWVRKHWRMGARIIKSAPRSMTIPGTIEQWQGWTGLRFPVSGTYAVPGGLAPLEVDVERDRAVYVEPNLWMQHQL